MLKLNAPEPFFVLFLRKPDWIILNFLLVCRSFDEHILAFLKLYSKSRFHILSEVQVVFDRLTLRLLLHIFEHLFFKFLIQVFGLGIHHFLFSLHLLVKVTLHYYVPFVDLSLGCMGRELRQIVNLDLFHLHDVPWLVIGMVFLQDFFLLIQAKSHATEVFTLDCLDRRVLGMLFVDPLPKEVQIVLIDTIRCRCLLLVLIGWGQ